MKAIDVAEGMTDRISKAIEEGTLGDEIWFSISYLPAPPDGSVQLCVSLWLRTINLNEYIGYSFTAHALGARQEGEVERLIGEAVAAMFEARDGQARAAIEATAEPTLDSIREKLGAWSTPTP